MYKATLFLITFLFSVGAHAATLTMDSYFTSNVKNVSTTSPGTTVVGSGETDMDFADYWYSYFELTTDEDTWVDITYDLGSDALTAYGRLYELPIVSMDSVLLYGMFTGSTTISYFLEAGTYDIGLNGFTDQYSDYSVTVSAVSAVPVPAAALLFAPALLGFVGLRRKTKMAA